MENWLLGYCHQCPDGTRPGRIVALASLRRNIQAEYVVDRPAYDLLDEIGPSGSVFWPQNPAQPYDLCGCLVRFRTIKSNEYGDPLATKDWLRVCRGQSSWEVHRIGFRIAEQGPDIQWRQEPRWVKGFPEGERVFVRLRATSTLVGPWRVGHEIPNVSRARELIPHPSPNKVFEYAVKDLDPECAYSERLTNVPLLDALLFAPDEALGRPVDLATPRQLAKWLVERMVAAAPQAVARFDREVPGWRTKVKDEIEGYGKPERHVFRSRWGRVESALDDLVFEAESAEKLLQCPKFLARVDELVSTQVAAGVAARAGEIEGEAHRKAKSTLERLDRETKDAEDRYCKAKERYDEVVKDVQARLDAAAAREQAVHALQSHLDDSRERLVKDLALYQSLLPGVAPHPTPSASPAIPSTAVTQPAPATKPGGPPIVEGTAFIESRLWPSLARWQPGVPRTLSVILHAAVCGAKAVIVPSPAWARAYADALGTFSHLTVVNTEPTWLGFADLWRGGLGACWERANRDESMVELILLRDFNRALPQCYARPLLDTIAGYCDALPEPAGGGWPKSLRLLACPAPPDEALPLSTEVVRHFAAVQRMPVAVGNERPKALAPGHVTAETWAAWARPASPADPDPELIKDFGPLAHAAAADAATIAQVLRAHGMVEREAKRTARDVRLSEPAEYLGQQDTDVGVSR